LKSITAKAFSPFIEEEQSVDMERSHIAESVGFFAFRLPASLNDSLPPDPARGVAEERETLVAGPIGETASDDGLRKPVVAIALPTIVVRQVQPGGSTEAVRWWDYYSDRRPTSDPLTESDRSVESDWSDVELAI
jgi:hypothetical protein